MRTNAAQQITVTSVSTSKLIYGEAQTLAVKYSLQLKQSYNELALSGDSAESYIVEVRIKDGAGKFISCSKGYGAYTDEEGYACSDFLLLLSYNVKLYADQTIYLPLASLNIAEGIQSLQPVLRIKDKWGRVVMADYAAPKTDIEIPLRVHLNLAVRNIEVAESGLKNQSWDYKMNNDEDKPEVCWALLLGNKRLSLSPFRSNSYTYTDTSGNSDFEFVISKGDIFLINVLDYDLSSYSDKIGTMKVDMADMQKFSGSSFTSKFGKVLKMDFVVTIL
ncbi:MAG: hypothetical protein U0V74_06420 [Chitinophagales bacterium]